MENKEIKEKKNPLIVIVVVILIMIIAVMAYFLYSVINKKQEEQIPNKVERTASAGLVLNKTEEELEEEKSSGFTTDMNTVWHFDSGDSISNDAYIGNDENNSRTIYFELYLSDDANQELLYSSPYIPVGSYLNNLKLDKSLPKGSYPAICTYHLVDDNSEDVGMVSVSVNLEILN